MTLLTTTETARRAGIAPKTLYQWLDAGLVQPSYAVAAKTRDQPVFTEAEADAIGELAADRRAARRSLRVAI